MKTLSASFEGFVTTSGIQTPIATVSLYPTTFPAPSYGINVNFWRNSLTATGDPDVGVQITGSDFAPLTNSGVYVTPQLWDLYGYNSRPVGARPTEDMLVRYEGYWYAENASTDFKVVCNPSGSLFVGSGTVTLPKDLSTATISYVASGNSDSRDAVTANVTRTAGSWHSFRFDHFVPKGTFGKVVVMWKPSTETDYRLLDCSSINTTTGFLSATTLSGVMRVGGQDEIGRTSTLSIEIANSSDYTYDSSTDAYGVLRPNRLLKAYTGYDGNSVQMGSYHIDNVSLSKSDGNEVLTVTARDTRKKAATAVNLLYPNFLSYDVAGYDSDTVFNDPDGKQRYVAFDSWTLAKTIRTLLYHSGFTSDSLWAKDVEGNYKIQENNIILNRESTYRLKLPIDTKQDQLKYAFSPGDRLLDLASKLAEDFGYEFGLDYEGEVYLREANNPIPVTAAEGTTTGGTKVESLNSYAGAYWTPAAGGTTFSYDYGNPLYGFNIVLDRTTASGTITVKHDGGVISGWNNYQIAYDKNWAWRNGVDPDVNYNPCVLEILRSGTTVEGLIEVVTSGGVRFGGYEIFTADRENPVLTFQKNRVLKVDVENTDDNIRNDVVVAGAEKGVDVGDNIIVSRSVDYKSIANPASKNFVGERKPFIFPKPEIVRQDVADYLSLSYLKKYRTLSDIVSYDIPGYPQLELGDCIQIADSGSGLVGTNFWVNSINWNCSPASYTMNVRLDPYKPSPSYEPIIEPQSPSVTISGFQFTRTDGLSLDPDLHTANTITDTAVTSGYYCPLWANNVSPVYVKLAFDLYQTSYVTVTLRDKLTFKPVAVLATDELREWGTQEFLWDGKWWDTDHKNYNWFPIQPGWTTEDLAAYKEYGDYVGSANKMIDAGYVFADVVGRTINGVGFQSKSINASDTAKDYVKVILPPEGERTRPEITSTIITTASRYDVADDEFVPSGEFNGVKFEVSWTGEPAKINFLGSLDFHLLLTSGTSFSAGDVYIEYPKKFTAESFTQGFNLYQILDDSNHPWSLQLINGETDFLPAGTYKFLLNPIGLTLFEDNTGTPMVTTVVEVTNRGLGTVTSRDYAKRYRWSPIYYSNYLDDLVSAYPGKYVNAAWYLSIMAELTNKAGVKLKDSSDKDIKNAYCVRIDPTSNLSKKHCYFASLSETYAFHRYRTEAIGNGMVTHFTCQNSSVGYKYD